MVKIIEIVAAQVLNCETEEISKESYDLYGMDVYSANDEEYAIATDAEATEAAKEAIRQSLWAFNPEFVLNHSKAGTNPAIVKALRELQAKTCEDANPLIEAIIEDLDVFIADAIVVDGRGRFLAIYDGEEQEIEINGITFYAYRLN